MHQSKAGSIVLLALMLSAVMFVACDLGGSNTTTGSMVITLQDEVTARTIEPGLNMAVAVWRVSATRVGFSDVLGPIDVTSDTHTFTGILTGSWIVKVEAFNNDSSRVKIGEGSATVSVEPGTMAQASISVVPLTGNGRFTFTLDWTDNLIGIPSLEAFLTPEGASTQVVVEASDISISGSIATITVDSLPTGYYDFRYILKQDGQIFAGNFHEVRILADHESSATEIVPVSPLGLSLSITNNLRNPFDVSITSADFTLECANTQTFSVAPANAASFQWYLDGVLLAGANEATYELDGEGIMLGNHNLAVKVQKADGSIASATVLVLLDPASGTGGYMYLLFTNKNNPDDTWQFWMPHGPAKDSGFDDFGTFPEYNVPIQLELMMEESTDTWLPGSFVLASSVPLDINANLDMFPMGGTEADEHLSAALGPWNVDASNVILDHAYDWGLFTGKIVDGNGFRKDFNAKGNFHNPLVDGVPKWGDLSEVGDVSVTFTKYGTDIGSYVKGTVSGEVLSVIRGTPQTLGVYTVEGNFVATRGSAASST